MKQVGLDSNARLEFGFRIQSTQASYRELEKLLGADQKVAWARTLSHPNQTKFFRIDAEIDQNGKVDIPNRVVDAFTRYGGFMMVKLVSSLPFGRYSNLAMKTPDNQGKLWDFDKVDPRRANGDWVYSMPIHGLEKAGEGFRFFFVIRLDRESDGNMTLSVDKVTITRGKEHFTVTRKTYPPLKATNDRDLAAIAERHKENEYVGGKMQEVTPLKGLPLAKAIRDARGEE